MAVRYLQVPRSFRRQAIRPLTCYFVTNADPLASADQYLIDLLANQGVTCFVKDQGQDTLVEANFFDFVYLSENVSSSSITDTYLHYQKPIINNENGLLDDMQWRSGGSISQEDNTIVDAIGWGHRILDLAGMGGPQGTAITIYSSSAHIVAVDTSAMIAEAEHLLLYSSDTGKSALSVIPAGATRQDGSKQPAVGIWLGPYTENLLNETGDALIQAVFQYVIEQIESKYLPDYYTIPIPAGAQSIVPLVVNLHNHFGGGLH